MIKKLKGQQNIGQWLLKYKTQLLCIGAGFALYALTVVLQPGSPQEVKSIERAGYSNSRTEKLYVEGIEDEPVEMEITVGARRYRDDELQDAMEKCAADAVEMARGSNPSMDEVRYDLNLKESVGDYGFLLSWTPEDHDLIKFDGTVINDGLTEPAETMLRLTVSNDQASSDYAIPVTLMPRVYTLEEQRRKEIKDSIAAADESMAVESKVVLPAGYDGRQLVYRDGTDTDYNFLWVLGIVFAVLLLLRDKEKAKQEEKTRQRQMQLDYPEIVSKLMLFVGAGMSVRTAWNAVAEDYEASVSKVKGKPEPRYAYEELCRANARMKTGTPEGMVYRQFGRECGSRQYMKLASLLEQNMRSGVANMNALLQNEMTEAWAERKNLALRQGEEASTRLMLPLMMLLIVVMVIIMVPALMNM